MSRPVKNSVTGLLILGMLLGNAGCHLMDPVPGKASIVPLPGDGSVPRELSKAVLPPYVIEAPDLLYIQVLQPPTEADITGVRSGTGDGKGVETTGKAPNPFSKSLDPQMVDGQFIVAMDGTVALGVYGTVLVAGLTKDQARERIRAFISEVRKIRPDALQVFVDVLAYNSKSYYIITDGAGYGEQVYAFPVVGSETVLDAMARINGLPQVASKKNIWLARRSPNGGQEQIMPVDWIGITQQGAAQTNYQVLPGDRIYVQAQRIISIDNAIAKAFAPIEKILGITLLGATAYQTISGRNVP